MSLTFGGLVEKTLRYMAPRPAYQVALTAAYTLGSTSMTFDASNPAYAAIRPGAVIDVDLEVFYVEEVAAPAGGNVIATVVPGFQGSVEAAHTNGTIAQINAPFTRWDIGQAINDEILSLSPAGEGLGQLEKVDIPFVPSFYGYDLSSTFQGASSRVMEVSYKIPPPSRTYPLIRRGDYRVIRNQDPTGGDFPSGNGIILYKDAYPGFPIRVQFLNPFSALQNLQDDALLVGGIPVYLQDIVVMGAEIRLATDREIQRNALNAQPDPRKFPEVPAGAVMNSTTKLEARRRDRINQELDRLRLEFPQAEWR